jgi:hypothetical protein
LASLALAFDILARDKASPTFKKVGDSVDRTAGKVTNLGGKFTNLGKVAAIGLGAAAVGAVALGKSFVDAAIESQKVTKQTEAVLKSMGDVAGVSADQVAEMSAQLSLQSGIDDELIQSSQNVLLTFGKVQNKVGKGNKIFDRATKAALDMSVALGTDMQGATIQVGKALNDPIKGITALSRAGVSFTQKQKDTIKSLVEQGKVLDAQKIILGELEKQFGGSAAAQATAGDRLKVVWGNLQEELGMRLLPVVERVAEWLGNVLPPALDALAGFLQPVIDQVGLFWGALSSGKTEDEGTPIESVALAVRDAFEALKVWWDENGETIKTTVGGVIGSIKDTLVTVATTIKETLLPKLQEFGAWLIKDGPGMEIAIAGIAAAMGVYALNVAFAAGATLIAAAPFLLAAVAIGALAWAAGELSGKIDLWGKVNDAFNAIIPLLETMSSLAHDVVDAIEALIAAAKRIPDLPFVPGGSDGDSIPFLPGWLEDQLPFMDDGGVWPGPRGKHSLGWVAGGETVIPTHKPGVSLGGDLHLHVTQLPGENQVDAGMRALRHHKQIRVAMAPA